MYHSDRLTSQELLKVRLYLFDRQLWEQTERIIPRLRLTPALINHRAKEVQETIRQAEFAGILFEPPFVEDMLCYV